MPNERAKFFNSYREHADKTKINKYPGLPSVRRHRVENTNEKAKTEEFFF